MKRYIFDNEERRRYYGIRIGDIVNVSGSNSEWNDSEVTEYGALDNNKVYIKNKNGKTIHWVAEWLTIVTKVEDRKISQK